MPTGLPREAYVSEDVFEAEVRRIFLRQWMFAAHESQLAAPGDFVVEEVAGESFVVVRDDAGSLQAFLNTCRHRGFRFCEEAHGCVRRFVCPYHQWTYGLDGRLLHVPGTAAGDHFEYGDWGLHRAARRGLARPRLRVPVRVPSPGVDAGARDARR